ncbi:hypothetical protein PSI81_004808, partial [Escherichia coli]|nr:hypothetical protein [Escherichia coli]EKL7024107.1 hypothetical protein [Escherichia coli]EKP2904026.1 hypothetical protein [Escherichia coli]EKY6408296.1 hypothetical protein [Escherichia coli]ELB9869918.1 hypothetical protein [Escherichia coli]
MLIYPAADLRLQGRRAQPWDKTTTHKYRPGQYYDFRKHPELIETHLEDFVEYSDRQAIQTFFSFVKWINSNSSAFESTDCMFSGTPKVDEYALVFGCTHASSGRFEFLFRDTKINQNERAVGWVLNKLSLYLQKERPDFCKGTFGIVPLMTEYTDSGGNEFTGYRICVYFDAYGNGTEDTWTSLNIMFDGLMKATKRMSNETITGEMRP